MRTLWVGLAGLAIVVVLALAWRLTAASVAPCDEYVDVALDDLDVDNECVSVTAQAHYEIVVKQRLPGNLLVEDEERYLFPLFAQGDTSNRAIRVFVRTERPPESLVTYETVTVSGRVGPVSSRDIPPGTEVSIGKKSDYFFTDGMLVLVPDRIESEGDVWIAPHAR